MAKAMYSTKAGSKCADCGAVINVGDPMVYFRPGVIYGLNCHISERQEKWRKQLPARVETTPATEQPKVDPILEQASALWR